MKIQKVTAVYAVVVGIGMIGMWIMFLLNGQVPELATKPAATYMHLAAEFLAAITSLVAGIGLWHGKSWASGVYLLSAGMVLYAVVQASGYFAHYGPFGFVFMFAGLALISAFLAFRVLQTDH
jgi:hypothetical protein